MKPTVAIVAPGNMGGGIGRRLAEHKITVLTTLAGRSAESARRAHAAGMRAVDEQHLMEADFLLSIVPPGVALTLAKRFAAHFAAADRKPIFVDCNAVSPATMRRIAEVITATGARFIAAGIIGPPPRENSTNTKIYASGPHAAELARLNEYGLNVRVLDGSLTAASALKMPYAGITKGFTALGAAMILAATREGSAAALKAELAESQPALMSCLRGRYPRCTQKPIAGWPNSTRSPPSSAKTAPRPPCCRLPPAFMSTSPPIAERMEPRSAYWTGSSIA